MKRYVLYMGLNDKNTHIQLIDSLEAFKIAQNIVLSYVGAASIFQGDGIFTHADGTTIVEKTFRIEIIDEAPESIAAIVEDLRRAFNQETIMQTEDDITVNFV